RRALHAFPTRRSSDLSAGRVDVLDGGSLGTLERIAKLDDADNVRYDRALRAVVTNIVGIDSAEAWADIPLSGHPESFQLEQDGRDRKSTRLNSSHSQI